MPYQLSDKIHAPSRLTAEQAWQIAIQNGALRSEFTKELIDEAHRLCEIKGWDFANMFAQMMNETGNFTSVLYRTKGNPGGIGKTGTDTSSGADVSRTYTNGKQAAQAMAVHTNVYAEGEIDQDDVLYPYIYLDPRYQAALTAKDVEPGSKKRMAGTVKALADWNVNGRWAQLNNSRYGDNIVQRGNEIVPNIPNQEAAKMPNIFRCVPHPPYVNLPVSKPSGGGYGYTQIPTGSRKIVGVMNHETQGRGSGPWYRDFFSCPNGQRCSDALVDYLITRDGTIYRLNDPTNNRSPWANGGPLGLEGDGPAFYARFGASGINNSLISIEYEKLDAEDFTDAQVQSGGLLNAYWHDQDEQDWETYPYVPRYGCVTSLAHFEIGTTNCGKGELDDITRLQAVARGEMKKWQTGAATPAEPDPPSVPDQPETPTLPGGAKLSDAVKAFGTLTRHKPDGSTKVMPFDPRGPISLSYTHRCVEVFGLDYDKWPAAEDWWAISDSGKTLNIITFSNDWQLVQIAERQGLMWARFADAELEDAS